MVLLVPGSFAQMMIDYFANRLESWKDENGRGEKMACLAP